VIVENVLQRQVLSRADRKTLCFAEWNMPGLLEFALSAGCRYGEELASPCAVCRAAFGEGGEVLL
jgi:hypothetical protein